MGNGISSALVVAENDMIHHYFFTALEKRFHSVTAVRSGARALTLLNTGRYDAVFINEYLPDMDCVDLLRITRKKRPGIRIFVMVSNRTDSATLCRRHGADGVIMKPFYAAEISRCLESGPARRPKMPRDSSGASGRNRRPLARKQAQHLAVFLR